MQTTRSVHIAKHDALPPFSSALCLYAQATQNAVHAAESVPAAAAPRKQAHLVVQGDAPHASRHLLGCAGKRHLWLYLTVTRGVGGLKDREGGKDGSKT